jgi:hypothetical protein
VIPCIPIPSPQQINNKLFPEGVIKPKELPSVWNAQAGMIVIVEITAAYRDSADDISSTQLLQP